MARTVLTPTYMPTFIPVSVMPKSAVEVDDHDSEVATLSLRKEGQLATVCLTADEIATLITALDIRLRKLHSYKRYPNGKPMFAVDGTMLDEHGNRSIFDDVDC